MRVFTIFSEFKRSLFEEGVKELWKHDFQEARSQLKEEGADESLMMFCFRGDILYLRLPTSPKHWESEINFTENEHSMNQMKIPEKKIVPSVLNILYPQILIYKNQPEFGIVDSREVILYH